MNRIDKVPTLFIDALLATNKLFGDDCNWTCPACEAGMMRYRGKFCFGPAGIEGTLAMGIPPKSPEINNQDAWEVSSHSLEWDWWSCLGIQTIPPENGDLWESGLRIIFFIMRDTFFDRPLELIKTITLTDTSPIDFSGLSTGIWAFHDKFDEHNSKAFKQLLELEFDAKFIKYEYIN